MELSTVAKVVQAFYRLVGSDVSDLELVFQGEAAGDVAYTFLTRGCRNAQRWMLKQGYGGWRKRSSALTWTGTDATTGGRYFALPADFLRAYGNERISALTGANGDRWGQQIRPDEAELQGDGFYFLGDELWLTRTASAPSPVYLDYHSTHEVWSAALTTIDFPVDARFLIVAEAANVAKEENWLPGGIEMETKIERALARARSEAMDIARPTKQARQMKKPVRYSNRW